MAQTCAGSSSVTYKVGDLGISQLISAHSAQTSTVGTVRFQPPEVLTEGLVSLASDVYSFGCIVYEACCGRPLFAGRSDAQVMYQVLVLRQAPEVPPECPPHWRAVMERCWHRDPLDRPTIAELRRVLLDIQHRLS